MQIQINCQYFRTSTYINNGVQQQVHVCVDQNCPIDPMEYCVGSKCRFANIDEKKEENKEDNITTETKEEVTV